MEELNKTFYCPVIKEKQKNEDMKSWRNFEESLEKEMVRKYYGQRDTQYRQRSTNFLAIFNNDWDV